MKDNKFLSDVQLELLKNKLEVNEKFELSELKLELKLMDTYEEYLEVRPLIEHVSRANLYHSEEYVHSMVSNPLYYPFVVKLIEDNEKSAKIIGYLEVYILPHLGRMFDSRLERVFITPEYRNNGIFRYIVSFIIEFCKSTLKCNRIDLTCENPVAKRVYESYEFEKVDTTLYRKYL